MAEKAITPPHCDALIALLGPTKVFLPGSTGYAASAASYFSPQAASIRPACYVAPQTVDEVSAVIKTLTSSTHGGPHEFAVRSGGHTWFAAAASSSGGVTIDLRGLRAVSLSTDKSMVSVGAGATWDLVYGALDPLGLSVAGGRVAGVGIGGLTLGGGISYFGPREGWTCDQATAFEVVLADGSVVSARSDGDNSDLWWGLRGGSNNFGVVTRIDFRTFEQPGPLWYAMTFNPLTVVEEQIRVYADLMAPQNYDVNASYLTGWAYAATHGLSVALNQLVYTRPDVNATPAYFKPVLDLPSITTGISGTVVANMSTLAAKSATMQVPQAAQYMTATVTFEPTLAMIQETYAAFAASLPQIQDVADISWALNLEPLPPQLYAHNNTSNALGLHNKTNRTLAVCLISPSWSDGAQNSQVYAAARALLADIVARAKKLGVYDPYIYLAYAAPWQDVIPSYGAESVRKLQKLRRRVDPRHVFTEKVTGGFKIPDDNDDDDDDDV
ncbi:putative oxidoreductase [Astrocystis sublimbata]|nr:putative oxidoreductase [Astrocystis sublimbata]